MLKNTESSYGSVTKFFHWTIFLLVLLMIVVGYFMDDIPNDDIKFAVFNLHKLTGLVLLVFVVLRALWAWMNPRPALPLDTRQWQRSAEKIIQFFIYVMLLVMPLSGWIFSTAAGHPPHLFDWQIAFPVDKSDVLKKYFFWVHEQAVIVLMALVGIHICAALYHHFIKKDNVLRRMMPSKG